MEFHVWEFPEKMEVRLNDAFIDRIRNMTVRKTIHVKKKPSWGHGWKKPHAVEYDAEIDAKLIAHREGHPYHKIAERLYPEFEWHGEGRSRTPHKPFISIKQFKTVHKVTGIPLEEMEKNVTEVRNHYCGHLEIAMTFPVTTNRDWAWLFGLWYSCGGLITRKRKGIGGYVIEERSVRLSVDRRVFDEKVKQILERICYVPKLNDRWYIRKGMDHKLDKNRRKGVGNQPRKELILVRPIREIMEKFGLAKKYPSQKHRVGAKYSSRRFHILVPGWVKENEENTHAFIEGYINGGTIGSDFRKDVDGYLTRVVEIRFGGFKRKEVYQLYEFFEAFLAKKDISGSYHILHHRQMEKLIWCGYTIYRNSSLSRLYEEFDIRRPDIRARLTLHYFMNALLYEVCRELNSSEILVLGCLMEKAMNENEIKETLRFRQDTVKECVQTLETLDLALNVHGVWCVNPTGYRDNLIKKLWAKELRRRKYILANNCKFFSRCGSCGNVIDRNFKGSCGCGGQYHPIRRSEVLLKFSRRNHTRKIREVINETIPRLEA